MKFLLSVILIALLSAVAEHFFPWWAIGVVSFIVSAFISQKPWRAFLMGFYGIAFFWLVAALLHDVANGHILSTRMAALFHLPHYTLFICVTIIIGGFVGGFSALAGALMRPRS